MSHRNFFYLLITLMAIGAGLYIVWYNTSGVVTFQVKNPTESKATADVFISSDGFKKQYTTPFSIELSHGQYSYLAISSGAKSINKKIKVESRNSVLITLDFEKLDPAKTSAQSGNLPTAILRSLPYYGDSFTASAQAVTDALGGFIIKGLNVDLILRLASDESVETKNKEIDLAKKEFHDWLKSTSIAQDIPVNFQP